MKYESFMPPALIHSNGETFVVPGWHKVSNDINVNDVHMDWNQIIPVTYKPTPKIKPLLEKVTSSSGKTYNVEFNGNFWICDCVGYGFRKTCKHIEQLKKQYTDVHD